MGGKIMRAILKNHNGALLSGPVPAGVQIVGEIIRQGKGRSGALVLLPSQQLAQANAGAVRTLEQGEAYCAITTALRADSGLSQAEWARAHNISAATVASWETGRRRPRWAEVKLMMLEAGIIDR